MVGALAAIGIMTTTIPMIVATGSVIKVMEATYRNDRTGKPVGTLHYHKGRKTKQWISHRHAQGHIVHRHPNMVGYGRTKKSFKIFKVKR